MKQIIKKSCVLALMFAFVCGIFLAFTASPVQAAKTKSVYVVKTNKSTDNYGGSSSYKYTYNSKGFLKKCKTSLSTYKYTYCGEKIVKVTDVPKKGYDSLSKEVTERTYNNKGLLKKEVIESKEETTTLTYKYNSKNQRTSYTIKVKRDGKTSKSTVKISYNAKGQMKKISSGGFSISYEYDKYGMSTKETTKWKNEDGTAGEMVNEYENQYKKGRLIKRIERRKSGDADFLDYENITTYTYKKIKVPKKYAKKVKEQQKDIIANNAL